MARIEVAPEAPGPPPPEALPSIERRHRREISAAFELGWQDGWLSCLYRIDELGIEEVLRRERESDLPQHVSLWPAEPDG